MAPEAPRNLDLLQAPPSVYLLPYHIAYVVDGVVEEIMHFDERTASVMLANPTIKQVDLTSEGGPDVGWTYNSETNTFSAPA
jgi:hypothetical protein